VDGVFGGRIRRCIESGSELIEEDDNDRRRVGDEIEEGIDGSLAGEVVGEGNDEANQDLSTGRRERVFTGKDRRVPPAVSMSAGVVEGQEKRSCILDIVADDGIGKDIQSSLCIRTERREVDFVGCQLSDLVVRVLGACIICLLLS
jgi:hypothetical protein